jgi:CRISPR-associated protein Csh2
MTRPATDSTTDEQSGTTTRIDSNTRTMNPTTTLNDDAETDAQLMTDGGQTTIDDDADNDTTVRTASSISEDLTQPNRSDILLVWDGVNCNPNGNPLGGDDAPRQDEETEEALVSPYRIKRYIRDQLFDDGDQILIKSSTQNGFGRAASREELYRLVDDTIDVQAGEDPDDATATGAYVCALLDSAIDIRLFGAALSIDDKEDRIGPIVEALPRQFRGPIQFGTARSLHPVELNHNTSDITTVISSGKRESGEARKQGTFGKALRVKYALIAGDGTLDNRNAQHTRMTAADAEQLDRTWWKAMKNQTTSASKVGQSPRLYLRVAYEDAFSIGGLSTLIDLDTGEKGPEELRSIDDVTLDVTRLVERLRQEGISERIEGIELITDLDLQIRIGDEVSEPGSAGAMLVDHLDDRIPEDAINVINPYVDINWGVSSSAVTATGQEERADGDD